MAYLFGDSRPDGKIRVWRTTHRMAISPGSTQTREVTQADAPLFPDGWWFDALPEAPTPQPGINHIMLFAPASKEFSWETEERPWTTDETMQEMLKTVVLTADKTQIVANGIDAATVTATVTGGATVAYVLVNGPPNTEVPVTDGKAVFDVSVAPEDAGNILVEVAAGDKKSFIILKAVV